jgi:hypothetical protein
MWVRAESPDLLKKWAMLKAEGWQRVASTNLEDLVAALAALGHISGCASRGKT